MGNNWIEKSFVLPFRFDNAADLVFVHRIVNPVLIIFDIEKVIVYATVERSEEINLISHQTKIGKISRTFRQIYKKKGHTIDSNVAK